MESHIKREGEEEEEEEDNLLLFEVGNFHVNYLPLNEGKEKRN